MINTTNKLILIAVNLSLSLLYSFQPQTKNELEIAIDLWVSDSSAAIETYGEINTWDVSLITDMSYLFTNRDSFNSDISSWDVSNVTNMLSMFAGASSFNQDLSSWDVSNVTEMGSLFSGGLSSFNGDISTWDVSNVINMSTMFESATSFNQDLSNWDVSNVIFMDRMFWMASSFNGDISTWDVSGISNMYLFLSRATNFNQDLSGWDVSNVENLSEMFSWAESFNQDLSNWDVSSVDNMGAMFKYATSFNGDISTWDVSSVTNISEFLFNATNFNQDLSEWDVSSVYHFGGTFWMASSFNGDISTWDVSNATYMNHMFHNATSFNGDISTWDVSSVTDMNHMFDGATSFTSDISSWGVSSVNSMNYLFRNTSSFDQNISDWDITNVTSMLDIFSGEIGLSDENKSYIQIAFSSNESWPYDWSDLFIPQITAIFDIPNDQGGRVYIEFNASSFDNGYATNQLYSLFRYDTFENDSSGWVSIETVGAIGDENYTYEATTLMDSTSENDGMTEFKVVASTAGGIFHSEPMMGYSIDNILPGVPEGIVAMVADNTVELFWNESVDEDFQYFIVEKSYNNMTEVTETADSYYVDYNYISSEVHSYRVAAVDHAGNQSDFSEVVEVSVLALYNQITPNTFTLHQNYPNPFNPATQIKYDLPKDAFVNISIYDVMGRMIKSLSNANQTAGYHSLQWDATNDFGEGVSAGMYIYTIQAGEYRSTKKMVLLK